MPEIQTPRKLRPEDDSEFETYLRNIGPPDFKSGLTIE